MAKAKNEWCFQITWTCVIPGIEYIFIQNFEMRQDGCLRRDMKKVVVLGGPHQKVEDTPPPRRRIP